MIEIKNLSVEFNDYKILKNCSLTISDGEFVVIIGPNGSGKTTFLKAILGFFERKFERLKLYNDDISLLSRKEIAQKISFLPQMREKIVGVKVIDFLLSSRFPYLDYFSSYTKDDYEIVEKITTELNIKQFLNRELDKLSGGELQRVFIASALIQDTDAIFLDEPTSFLDPNHRFDTFELLKDIHRNKKKTIVVVTHFLDYALNYGDRIVALKNGEVFFEGKRKEIVESDVFTKLFDIPLRPFLYNGHYILEFPKRGE